MWRFTEAMKGRGGWLIIMGKKFMGKGCWAGNGPSGAGGAEEGCEGEEEEDEEGRALRFTVGGGTVENGLPVGEDAPEPAGPGRNIKGCEPPRWTAVGVVWMWMACGLFPPKPESTDRNIDPMSAWPSGSAKAPAINCV